MSRTAALLKAGEEAKAALEEKLSIYVENLDYLQEKLESGGSKISKGYMAVERLQAEGKQLREKIKMKSEIIRKQVISKAPSYALVCTLFSCMLYLCLLSSLSLIHLPAHSYLPFLPHSSSVPTQSPPPPFFFSLSLLLSFSPLATTRSHW